MSSCFPVQMPIMPSVRACAKRLALYLGPADQHSLVLSVSVFMSVSDPADGYAYDSIHHLPDNIWCQLSTKGSEQNAFPRARQTTGSYE